MECVVPIVTAVCAPLGEAFGSWLRTQAERGFSFLGDLAGGALWNRILQRRNRVLREPTETCNAVGLEETLQAIRGHLRNDRLDVIGIVGMGGVGKTTLLKEINNDLCKNWVGKFDIVIFATVSKEGNALKVQKQIVGRLGQSEMSNPCVTNQEIIRSFLSGKSYLLLLDDLWGNLNLGEIGVPLPNKSNRCKIVLTTRSLEVFGSFLGTWCNRQERACTVNMSPLDATRSLQLFRGMLDAEVDIEDPHIKRPAETIVQKCGGLPLALVTMGRAMAAATSPAQWRLAVAQLDESVFLVPGMEIVKSCLMFSINQLEEGTLLPCFLYCSLFPEDYNIPEEQLVEYWIGEGFLDASDAPPRRQGKGVKNTISPARARDIGQDRIQKLKHRYLLETGSREDQQRCVKMHDLVREVALLLGSREPNSFLVHATECPSNDGPSRDAVHVEGWEEATRVSLMNCLIDEASLPKMPDCPKASTLLMHNLTFPQEPPDDFFTNMGSLRVLDLSQANYVAWYTNVYLRRFPASICLLQELRYLNLSWTAIRYLPKELGNLRKLTQLDLSETHNLKKIPYLAISRLSSIQVLNMSQSRYGWGQKEIAFPGQPWSTQKGMQKWLQGIADDEDRPLCVKDLYGLEQLQDIGIDLRSLDFLSDATPSRSHSLLRSITRLGLVNISDLSTKTLLRALRAVPSLRELQIRNCENLIGELVLDGSVDIPVLCDLEILVLRHVPLSAIAIVGGGRDEGDLRERTGRRGGLGGGAKGLPLEKLRRLHVARCAALQDLEWVAKLRLLELINVSSCKKMETLLGDVKVRRTGAGQGTRRGGGSTKLLPKLRSLKLSDLPKLRSICDPAEYLPSLECLHVIDCPLLTKLPLGPNSMIKRIEGAEEWWKQVMKTLDEEDVSLPFKKTPQVAYRCSTRHSA